MNSTDRWLFRVLAVALGLCVIASTVYGVVHGHR